MINTPILFIAFNRPDTTRKVFNRIREVKPKKLYIAQDGARDNKAGEKEKCDEVRNIIKKVDWECECEYLIREKNFGCKNNIVTAITQVFEKEDRVIIIEDDVLPEKSFFHFAEILLEKYKDDESIGMISANNYTPLDTNDSDYILTRYAHIWGWATWKRTWIKYNVDYPELGKLIENDFNQTEFLHSREKRWIRKFAKRVHKKINNGSINAWGPQFFTFLRLNNLFSICPKVNLASNIANESSRTDIKQNNKEFYFPSDENFWLNQPSNNIEYSTEFDKHHFKHFVEKFIARNSPMIKRIYRKIIRVSKSIFIKLQVSG